MLNSAWSVVRTRLISRVARSECPPSSKKPSSMPTLSRPSTSANSAQRISSCGVRGARPVLPAPKSGAGRAFRSSLPFGVTGMASRTTMALGTMYSGSRSPTRSRRAAGSRSGSPFCSPTT